MNNKLVTWLLAASLVGCAGAEGKPGAQGVAGIDGEAGATGKDGANGADGANGTNGSNGLTGADGLDGRNGVSLANDPLSSLVAVTVSRYSGMATMSIGDYVKYRVDQVAAGTLPSDVQFPLSQGSTDELRMTSGLQANMVVSWLDPLTYKTFNTTTGELTKSADRFGANTDFTAFFGDGWSGTPYFNGADDAGYVWTNHEYVSGILPEVGARPYGQALTLAKFLVAIGELTINVEDANAWDQLSVDKFYDYYKRQMGGSYFRVLQDPATGYWSVDRNGSKNERYDASSDTRIFMSGNVNGTALATYVQDHSDNNAAAMLPAGVIAGTLANCSGGVTPWGTIISAEENAQDYYGDTEQWWNSSNQLVAGMGADSGAPIVIPTSTAAGSEFSRHSSDGQRHPRNQYGWLTEIDPGVLAGEHYGKTTAGKGHAKLGALGRARWENAAFAMDTNWELVDGQKVVAYYGDDRRNGRVYKFVSESAYAATMTTAQKRALLERGKVYVAHFAGLRNTDGYSISNTTNTVKGSYTYNSTTLVVTPSFTNGVIGDIKLGQFLRDSSTGKTAEITSVDTIGGSFKVASGTTSANMNGGGFSVDRGALQSDGLTGTWLELSLTNSAQMAVNNGGITVGAALSSNTHNSMGGFASQWDVLNALHTASNKIGVFELNRPEDIEWNPGDELVYIALTNHTGVPSLNSSGVYTASQAARADRYGRIWAIDEDNADPALSTSFTFWEVWSGYKSSSDNYAAANPDNLMIDADFDVWFGTDGNFGTSGGFADSIYYLDLDPAHMGTTYGKAFRVVSVPSDAEATGPALTAGMGSLFLGVQHPGESNYSAWPNAQ